MLYLISNVDTPLYRIFVDKLRLHHPDLEKNLSYDMQQEDAPEEKGIPKQKSWTVKKAIPAQHTLDCTIPTKRTKIDQVRAFSFNFASWQKKKQKKRKCY